MNIFNQAQSFVTKNQLIKPHDTIVVGFSGGPDSVFLLQWLHALSREWHITLIAAHLNHEWRPESREDEQFCRTMAQKLGITLVSAKASELPKTFKSNGSKEEIGRAMRRFFLEHTRQEYNASSIALAHHTQDQQETFFIRLLRGASVTGLGGMRPKSGNYIRPLLELNKADIIAYLTAHNIPFVIDPSNEDPRFLRNCIRHSVIPALQQCDARFDAMITRTMHHLQETDDLLHQIAEQIFKDMQNSQKACQLSIERLKNLHPILQQRIVLYWLVQSHVPFFPSQAMFNEIMRFLFYAKQPSHAIHEQWTICKKNEYTWIEKK